MYAFDRMHDGFVDGRAGVCNGFRMGGIGRTGKREWGFTHGYEGTTIICVIPCRLDVTDRRVQAEPVPAPWPRGMYDRSSP